jgi:hypothetical protein
MAPYSFVRDYHRLGGTHFEHGDSIMLRNICSNMPEYTVSHSEAQNMSIYRRENLKFRILRMC